MTAFGGGFNWSTQHSSCVNRRSVADEAKTSNSLHRKRESADVGSLEEGRSWLLKVGANTVLNEPAEAGSFFSKGLPQNRDLSQNILERDGVPRQVLGDTQTDHISRLGYIVDQSHYLGNAHFPCGGKPRKDRWPG